MLLETLPLLYHDTILHLLAHCATAMLAFGFSSSSYAHPQLLILTITFMEDILLTSNCPITLSSNVTFSGKWLTHTRSHGHTFSSYPALFLPQNLSSSPVIHFSDGLMSAIPTKIGIVV